MSDPTLIMSLVGYIIYYVFTGVWAILRYIHCKLKQISPKNCSLLRYDKYPNNLEGL